MTNFSWRLFLANWHLGYNLSIIYDDFLNGKEMIKFSTNSMIFGVEEYIHQITKYLTLYPGDVIWMGTDGAAENMAHGDICQITITGIGTLENSVVRLT